MLFDNAEMRKQLNAYTEGILLQTMERLAVAAPPKALGRSSGSAHAQRSSIDEKSK